MNFKVGDTVRVVDSPVDSTGNSGPYMSDTPHAGRRGKITKMFSNGIQIAEVEFFDSDDESPREIWTWNLESIAAPRPGHDLNNLPITVYVAGPLSGPLIDGLNNYGRMLQICARLKKMGFAPYFPAWDFSLIQAYPDEFDYDSCMKGNAAFLPICHCMYFMGESPGANRERALAEELDIPIFIDLTELERWAKWYNGKVAAQEEHTPEEEMPRQKSPTLVPPDLLKPSPMPPHISPTYPEGCPPLVSNGITIQGRPFQVGDRVTVVKDPEDSTHKPYLKGVGESIYAGLTGTVIKTEGKTFVRVFLHVPQVEYLMWSWNILHAEQPEPPANKFKIGDRVQVVAEPTYSTGCGPGAHSSGMAMMEGYGDQCHAGQCGKVAKVNDDFHLVTVELPGPYYADLWEWNLQPESPKPRETRFKVGDRVRVVDQPTHSTIDGDSYKSNRVVISPGVGDARYSGRAGTIISTPDNTVVTVKFPGGCSSDIWKWNLQKCGPECYDAPPMAVAKTRGGHPRFYELLEKMADLHSRKNHDYAGQEDPLKNFKTSVGAGVNPWIGCLIRLGDKFGRLSTFAKQGTLQVKDESVTDTFLDMAVYSLLGLILFEEQSQGGKE